jgi:hypothetical protein
MSKKDTFPLEASEVDQEAQMAAIEVFGTRALTRELWEYASEGSVQKLIDIIEVLCNDKNAYLNRAVLSDEGRIDLTFNPLNEEDPRSIEPNKGLASIKPVAWGTKRILKQRGKLPPGKYRLSDILYVTQSGEARIQRSLHSRDTLFAQKNENWQTASKPASEQEVQNAIEVLQERAREDRKRRSDKKELIELEMVMELDAILSGALNSETTNELEPIDDGKTRKVGGFITKALFSLRHIPPMC